MDYSSYLGEYELIYRSTTDLSITSKDTEPSKATLKDIALSSYKLLK